MVTTRGLLYEKEYPLIWEGVPSYMGRSTLLYGKVYSLIWEGVPSYMGRYNLLYGVDVMTTSI